MDIGDRTTKLVSTADDIKIWSLENRSLIRSFNPHNHTAPAICWSHDNSFLVSGSPFSNKISIDYLKGQPSVHLPYEQTLTCLDLNSTSRYLVTGNKESVIEIWDLHSGKIKKSYKNHQSPVSTVQFNSNDSYIASGSDNGEIILHNVVTGIGSSPIIVSGGSKIHEVRYSNFRKSLLGSASDDGGINLWDTNTRQLLHKFRDHRAPATGLKFSTINDVLLMSCGLDKKINLYDVHTKMVVKTINMDGFLTSVDMMSDGATIAAGTTRGQIYLFDLRKASDAVGTLVSHKSAVLNLRFQNEATQKHNSSGSKANFSSEPISQGSPNPLAVKVSDPPVTVTPVRDDPSYARLSKDESLDAFSPLSQRGRESLESQISLRSDRSNNYEDSQDIKNWSNLAISPLAADSSHHSLSRHSTSLHSNTSSRSFMMPHMEMRVNGSSIPRFEVPEETQASGTSGDELTNSHNKTALKDCSASSSVNEMTPTSELNAAGMKSGDGNFHVEFIRNVVRDAMEEFEDRIHNNFVNMHVEMIRQIHLHQLEMKSMLQHYSVNEELVKEVERLRIENERLKSKF